MDAITPAPAPVPAHTLTKVEQQRLRESAREIEAVFVQQLLKTMRQATPAGGVLSGTGQRVYQDMMDEQLGRAMAKGGGLGLADMLVRDVLRRQAVAKNPSSQAPTVPTKVEGGKP